MSEHTSTPTFRDESIKISCMCNDEKRFPIEAVVQNTIIQGKWSHFNKLQILLIKYHVLLMNTIESIFKTEW